MTSEEALNLLKPEKYFKIVSKDYSRVLFGICCNAIIDIGYKKKMLSHYSYYKIDYLYLVYLGKTVFSKIEYITISDGIAVEDIKYIAVGDSEEEVRNNALLMEEIYE